VERQRLFISLDLPLGIKEAAGKVQERLQEAQTSKNIYWNIIWTRPGGMHLTLKFLGEVEAGRIQEIQAALVESIHAFRPISIAVEGLGGFPTMHAPRVIWLGIKEPSGELLSFQKRVDQAVAPLGFPPEMREFHPHLTLGRVKSPKGRDVLVQVLKALDPGRLGEWRLEELNLMQSMIQPDGTVYTKLSMMKAEI
jgi:2'-5' RNA ligase